MSLRQNLRDDPKATLFAAMGNTRTGMLGVEGSGQHLQPMTHYPDAEKGEIWFLSSRQTDLVRAIGQGARAHFVFTNEDHDLHACMAGAIVQLYDDAKIDEIWSPVAAAWFPEGRQDPDLIALRLTLQEASVWASTESSVRFGIEILRSNLSEEHQPDVGDHIIVEFNT